MSLAAQADININPSLVIQFQSVQCLSWPPLTPLLCSALCPGNDIRKHRLRNLQDSNSHCITAQRLAIKMCYFQFRIIHLISTTYNVFFVLSSSYVLKRIYLQIQTNTTNNNTVYSLCSPLHVSANVITIVKQINSLHTRESISAEKQLQGNLDQTGWSL